MTLKFKKTLPLTLALGLFCFFFLLFEITLLFHLKGINASDKSVIQVSQEKTAQEIVRICENAPHKPSCYDKTIPKFSEKLSMQEAFKLTSLVQRKDESYAYCHVLGHELSAREVKKDPDTWKDIISQCPSGVCSNGCIHGAFQERYKKESFTTQAEIDAVKPELANVCEKRKDWNPTGLEQASCYHALGHLTMYITDAELTQANSLCEELALKNDGRDFRQLCFDGAFMQIFQPLEPEDFALVKGKQPTKETVVAFCNRYTDEQQSSCISESWPLFHKEIQTKEGFVAHCEHIPSPSQRDRCYSVLIYIITPTLNFDEKRIAVFCNSLSSTFTSLCFTNAATRMLETDYSYLKKAVFLCSSSPLQQTKDNCFNEIIRYSTYNYHAYSQESQNVCNALPKPWRDTCSPSTQQKQSIN